jgi:hypothetical protein
MVNKAIDMLSDHKHDNADRKKSSNNSTPYNNSSDNGKGHNMDKPKRNEDENPTLSFVQAQEVEGKWYCCGNQVIGPTTANRRTPSPRANGSSTSIMPRTKKRLVPLMSKLRVNQKKL